MAPLSYPSTAPSLSLPARLLLLPLLLPLSVGGLALLWPLLPQQLQGRKESNR
jgi:hypothetical protein